jgi:hypothetical protein
MRPTNSPGTLPAKVIPKKSLSCVLAMTSAIPLVKPMTTGRGMNRTAVPEPVRPITTRTTPAIIVHMNRPSTPYLAMMPDTTTTNAPVGPPIWTYEPPIAEMMKPVTTAQYMPACGNMPEEMAVIRELIRPDYDRSMPADQ